MRSIVYVTTTFPTLATFLEDEIHSLRARGVRVRVLTLRKVGERCQPRHGALKQITESVGSPFRIRAWLALLTWLVRRPRVLIPEVARLIWASRGSGYALLGHLAYLPAAARVATLVEREEIEVVHGAWAHFPSTVAYLAACLTGRRFTMAAHAGGDLERTDAFLARKLRAAEFTTACVCRNAAYLRRLAGPSARVECNYHGVDLGRFNGRGRSMASRPLFLGVGRLAATKGFDVAIRAIGELARDGQWARLVLIGDGGERGLLESLARSEGVRDRVIFVGTIDQDSLRFWYRRAWALLAPCRRLSNGRQDGIPNVIIEAMAMGIPCIGTRAGGIAEAIIPGVNGWLVDPEDVVGMAARLQDLIEEPSSIREMGAAARARVLPKFDLERNFERLFSCWEGEPLRPEELFSTASEERLEPVSALP